MRIIAENKTLSAHSLMHMRADGEGQPLNVPKAYRHLGLFWYHAQVTNQPPQSKTTYPVS